MLKKIGLVLAIFVTFASTGCVIRGHARLHCAAHEETLAFAPRPR